MATTGIGIQSLEVVQMACGIHLQALITYVAAFILSKELLEPIRPITESLQGRLQEVYFGFKKVDEVTKFYHELRKRLKQSTAEYIQM